MTMTATPLSVNSIRSSAQPQIATFSMFEPNGAFGYDHNPSSLSYMSGTAAAALGLTQASGAIDSTPGGQQPTASEFMNNLVQNENSQFGSFQSNVGRNGADPEYLADLAAWAQSTDGLIGS